MLASNPSWFPPPEKGPIFPQSIGLKRQKAEEPWYFIPWTCIWQLTSVFLVYVVTNGILTGFNGRVKSLCYGSRFHRNDLDSGDPDLPPLPDECWYAPYFVSISYLMFTIGDLVSRFWIPTGPFIRRPWLCMVYALIRLVIHFVHSLGFANLAVGDYVPFGPAIGGDIGYWVSALALGFGTGNNFAICISSYPKAIRREQRLAEERSHESLTQAEKCLAQSNMSTLLPRIGKYMGLAMYIGCALGSWLGFVLKAALCQCNPFA